MKISWTSWFALAAIAAIVVAVGMASYSDYSHRAQAAEAVWLLASAKTPLAEYFQNQRNWPERLDPLVERTSGKFTQSIAITRGAGGAGEIELTATMRTEGVDQRVRGQTVRMLSGDGGKTWICRPGTMPNDNLSAPCRDGS